MLDALNNYSMPLIIIMGSKAKPDIFNREDVEEIHLLIEDENDESEWIGVFKLKDGRFEAGCNYTGWEDRRYI